LYRKGEWSKTAAQAEKRNEKEDLVIAFLWTLKRPLGAEGGSPSLTGDKRIVFFKRRESKRGGGEKNT